MRLKPLHQQQLTIQSPKTILTNLVFNYWLWRATKWWGLHRNVQFNANNSASFNEMSLPASLLWFQTCAGVWSTLPRVQQHLSDQSSAIQQKLRNLMTTVRKGTSSAGNKTRKVRGWLHIKTNAIFKSLTLAFRGSSWNLLFKVIWSTAGKMNIRNINTRDWIHHSMYSSRPTHFVHCFHTVLFQFEAVLVHMVFPRRKQDDLE